MGNPTQKIVTPLGELNWVFINGNTKQDLNGNDRYVASVYFHKDSPEFKQVEKEVKTFWDEHKPKGAKLKSNGIKVVQERVDGEVDDDGEQLYKDTEFMSLNFWTGPTFPNGKDKVIKTFNARGSEVSLGDKKIGNGTTGAISGVMGIYDNGPAAKGVTLYLNAIQIKKFVEFTGGDAGFEDTGDAEDDDFNGVEDTFESVEADETAKPRL